MNLYKNIRARNLLDILFVSAVASVLLVRFYLHVTGYPQLGAGGLHIAHVLWGGLLMLAGIVILLSFLGLATQRLAAFLGGIGFGLFIDEIGKFITSDNDYFYRPAVGIIYAIFVILYLTFNFLGRKTKLTSREYQLNALVELEEALSHDMDEAEKARAQTLLDQADQKSQFTKELQRMLNNVRVVAKPPRGIVAKSVAGLSRIYQKFWQRRNSSNVVRIFFVAQAVVIFIAVLATLGTNVDDIIDLINGRIDYGTWLLVGEVSSALVASLLAIRGALLLRRSRLEAFEQFRRATLINLYLTEFFTFLRVEFLALPGFFLNVALIIVISYAIRQEKRLTHQL